MDNDSLLLLSSVQVRRLEAALRKEARNHSAGDADGGADATLLCGNKRARESERDDGENGDSNHSNKITAIEELRELSVQQLREQASLYGIPVSGSKKQVIERISQQLQNGSDNVEDGMLLIFRPILEIHFAAPFVFGRNAMILPLKVMCSDIEKLWLWC